MFGIKMPWTRRREAHEAEEMRLQRRFEELQQKIVEKRRRARSMWAIQQPMSPIPVQQVATAPYVSSAPIEPMLINTRTHVEHPAPGVRLVGAGGTFDGGGASGNWTTADAACGAGAGGDASSSNASSSDSSSSDSSCSSSD